MCYHRYSGDFLRFWAYHIYSLLTDDWWPLILSSLFFFSFLLSELTSWVSPVLFILKLCFGSFLFSVFKNNMEYFSNWGSTLLQLNWIEKLCQMILKHWGAKRSFSFWLGLCGWNWWWYKYWRDWLGLDTGLVSTSSFPDTTDLAIPLNKIREKKLIEPPGWAKNIEEEKHEWTWY